MAQLLLVVAIEASINYLTQRLTTPNGPRLTDTSGIIKADYGGTLALMYGPENRRTCSIIDTSGVIETVHKHKPWTDYLFSLVGALLPPQKTYTYSAHLALALGAGPIRRVRKIWANKLLIFDAGASTALTFTKADGTHTLMDTVRVYQGTATQGIDPTLEAIHGVGNVPAYRGTAMVVLEGLQLTEHFANQQPAIEALVEVELEARLGHVVADMARRAGIDATLVSTSALTGTLRGLAIDKEASAWEAMKPLGLIYGFDACDVAGGLRFVPRKRPAITVVRSDQLGGHAYGETPPADKIRWIRAPETALPKEAVVNFLDPARDYQPNSQRAVRSGGSANSNVTSDLTVVMSVDEGTNAAQNLLWGTWSERATATGSTDDTRRDLECGRVYAFDTPAGWDTLRLTRRTRGANGKIDFEARFVRDGEDLASTAGAAGDFTGQDVAIPGPVNPPVIFEPSALLTANTPQIWMAISGGDGAVADPAWTGCAVYMSTDAGANYRVIGTTNVAAYQGLLTAGLALYGGANPDAGHTLSVDLAMSAGVLASITTDEAAAANSLCYVDGELVSFQTATATGGNAYDLTSLYRGLFGTAAGAHLTATQFARLDDAVFTFGLSKSLVGVALKFKFVAPGQELADQVAYDYTPTGFGFDTQAATVVVSDQGTPLESSVGSIDFTGSGVVTTTDGSGHVTVTISGAQPIDLVATEALSAGDLVSFYAGQVRLADDTDDTRQADGFVKANVAMGATAHVYPTGAVNDAVAGLTGGDLYFVGPMGSVTDTPPTTGGMWLQEVGRAADATHLPFSPKTGTLL